MIDVPAVVAVVATAALTKADPLAPAFCGAEVPEVPEAALPLADGLEAGAVDCAVLFAGGLFWFALPGDDCGACDGDGSGPAGGLVASSIMSNVLVGPGAVETGAWLGPE
jgi:hypothetical protein